MISRSERVRRRYFWCSLTRREKSTNRGHRPSGSAPDTRRTLIFHGYLLRGTGSNIYNASLAKALAKLGHEVHLLCQDAQAGELDFVDAAHRWVDGEPGRDPA